MDLRFILGKGVVNCIFPRLPGPLHSASPVQKRHCGKSVSGSIRSSLHSPESLDYAGRHFPIHSVEARLPRANKTCNWVKTGWSFPLVRQDTISWYSPLYFIFSISWSILSWSRGANLPTATRVQRQTSKYNASLSLNNMVCFMLQKSMSHANQRRLRLSLDADLRAWGFRLFSKQLRCDCLFNQWFWYIGIRVHT